MTEFRQLQSAVSDLAATQDEAQPGLAGGNNVAATSADASDVRSADRGADSSRISAQQLDQPGEQLTFVGPAMAHASPLELAASRFALDLVLRLGARFNLRRDLNNLVTLSGRLFVWPQAVLQRLQAFLEQRCKDLGAWQGVGGLSAQGLLDKHGVWHGLYDDGTLFYYLDEFVKVSQKDMLTVLQATRDALDQRLGPVPITMLRNLDLLATTLHLSAAERALLKHGALVKAQRELRPVLVDCKLGSMLEGVRLLADALHVDADELGRSLKAGGRLEMLALVDAPIAEHAVTDLSDLLRVSEKLLTAMSADDADEASLMANFVKPAPQTALTVDDFPQVLDDAKDLLRMLQRAVQQQAQGINVLLYGEPGTGKTELARALAQAAGCTLFEVECVDGEGASLNGRERYRSLRVAQSFLKTRGDAVIVFDEIEDVFPAASNELVDSFGHEEPKTASVGGKAWVNQTLEHNPVPTIWISNAISQIDPAYLRRFQFHLELPVPSRDLRERIARKQLAEVAGSESLVDQLIGKAQLTPAQLRSALRFADLVDGSKADAEDPQAFNALVLKQIERADRAMGKTPDAPPRQHPTRYDLELIHIESRYPMAKILQALKRKDSAAMCFYGPPGTGKTALAEYLAEQLQRPLMIRRASDLLSKFVGETEQQMAKMFAEAKREKAVLLLDEADSFFQSRGLAQRQYEVTEVNEMLQQMERHEGIFICTTNLFDRIDEAALRRFTFKIRFKAPTPAQRERLFINEVLDGDASRLTDAWRQRLARLDQLAHGDFAAVKRQLLLLDEVPQPDAFLDDLEREHAIKPEVRDRRAVGFTLN